LLEALRSPDAAAPEADSAEVVRLMRRLEGLPVGSATAAAAEAPPDYRACLAPPEGPDEIGRLGGYRVLEVLGTGGMGIVFLAEDVRLERRVALKVMSAAPAGSEHARQRFLREAGRRRG
jgi:serine/threonine protein kinase